MKLEEARKIVNLIADQIRPYCERLEIGGSIRRNKSEVKDGELIAIGTPELLSFTDHLVQEGMVSKALYGETQTTRWGEKYRGLFYGDMKIELFLADEDNWGAIYWLRTGPGSANTFIMKWLKWKESPIHSKDGYWMWGNKRLRIATEEAMFELLGMPFIQPQDRTEELYRSILSRWNGKWPDFSRFVIREPIKERPRVSTPWLDNFCRQRDENALQHYAEILPGIEAEIARLTEIVQPIIEDLKKHRDAPKNEREKIYARMEGADWQLQYLTAQRAALLTDIPVRQSNLERLGQEQPILEIANSLFEAMGYRRV